MRTITLHLDDEQFTTLYSMAESFKATNTNPSSEDAVTTMFQQIHDECESQANGIERNAVRTAAKQMMEMRNSPDMYLIKAGVNGMIETLKNNS